MKKILVLALASVLLSSCASIFLPKRQKVTFTTGNKDSKIYLENEEIGKGTTVVEKVIKDGSAKQIIVKTPGYKDTYAALVPSRRQTAYWFLQIPNPAWLIYYGFYIDAWAPKNMGYQQVLNIPVTDKLVYRGPTDKYVDISAIKLSIANKDKDIRTFSVKYSATDLEKNIKDAEKHQNEADAKAEMKKMKKKNKRNKLSDTEDKEMKYDDTKFSENVYQTLRKTGFVDTVNKFFMDINNSIFLEGNITKLHYYTISGRRGAIDRCKVFLTWYIKNNFGETLDSVITNEYSGDFSSISYWSYIYTSSSNAKVTTGDHLSKMFGDAVDISYLRLHSNPTFKKYLKMENDFAIKDPALTITTSPKSYVLDKSDAGLASVIVKTKDGHGSGFAISQDGYIITNYHVIAGKTVGKPNSVKIINSSGDEMDGQIVRYNRYRDIALIKVNKKFDKAFKVTNVKSFKNLQDVLTIGAPKSVELGQTVSSGIISNERKANGNNLLQLNMSVNSGNSGGPVFDGTGTLHGVIVSKAVGSNTEGISFAIPGYMIQEYLNISFK
ncbi:MAG TPA: trypsin-like peptidase domain-containing protein [Bacteroidia bacterium]|nr:trypsin-like peptidase domain-containing protein [Bacteroidia bacterium]